MISFKNLLGIAILSGAATAASAQVVGVATNPQGSAYYSVGAAIAGVVQQKGGIVARVQPMSGSTAYAPLVGRGQVEFGLMNVIDVVNAYEGVINFKDRKNPDLRLVGALFPITVAMGVPGNSPIRSIAELKGQRIPTQFTAQSTFAFVQNAMLANGGVAIGDVKPFPVAEYTKGTSALADGKVDAAPINPQTGAAQELHVALSSRGGLRYLPFSEAPEAVTAIQKVFPGAYLKMMAPSGGLAGITAPTRLMFYDAFLVTSTHVPDEVVYKVTKAVYENKVMLEAAAATLKAFDPSTMAQANTVPYHPGAEKFFKEAKQWPPKKL